MWYIRWDQEPFARSQHQHVEQKNHHHTDIAVAKLFHNLQEDHLVIRSIVFLDFLNVDLKPSHVIFKKLLCKIHLFEHSSK
jgi:hypothetical protein